MVVVVLLLDSRWTEHYLCQFLVTRARGMGAAHLNRQCSEHSGFMLPDQVDDRRWLPRGAVDLLWTCTDAAAEVALYEAMLYAI